MQNHCHRQDGLEAAFFNILQDTGSSWLTGSGPFCNSPSARCQCYFSWHPDPPAEATDAFLQVWTHIKGYANPPWNLAGRILTQMLTQQATIALVAPVWKSQP